ncbi:MAG: HAMP domain-containing sensor histidine kinase [Gammaproteobacteria bacterium]
MDPGHQNDKIIQDNANSSAITAVHNIGNILSSTTVCVNTLRQLTSSFTIENYLKAIEKLHEHLGKYPLTEEETLLLNYFKSLGQYFLESKKIAFKEIDQLDKHVEHIKQVVQGLQKVNRQQVVELTDLNTLIDDALCISRTERNEIRFVKEYSELPLIKLDKHLMLQVLTNLISNAENALKESTAPEKILRVATATIGDKITIVVEDNGVGILVEDLQHLFKQGFTTRELGHGIGLYFASQSIEQMGGRLEVQSDGLNKGSVFQISLPLSLKYKA